jgi:hypothetical protein
MICRYSVDVPLIRPSRGRQGAVDVPAGAVVATVGIAGSLILATRMSGREAVTMVLVVTLATAYWLGSGRRRLINGSRLR